MSQILGIVHLHIIQKLKYQIWTYDSNSLIATHFLNLGYCAIDYSVSAASTPSPFFLGSPAALAGAVRSPCYTFYDIPVEQF